jgi:MOB kinase activator 1
MTAGPEYEYLWRDKVNEQIKKSVAVLAPEYILLLMDWLEALINDPKIFPAEEDIPFPKKFQKTVGYMFRRLFRDYAHIFAHHLEDLKALSVIVHLNTSFKHFMYFTFEFDLIPSEELMSLKNEMLMLLGNSYASYFPENKRKE